MKPTFYSKKEGCKMQQIGAIPFGHWREKAQIIREIKKKFKNKVKIHIENNLIIYECKLKHIDGFTY
jgi:hypothetical protein